MAHLARFRVCAGMTCATVIGTPWARIPAWTEEFEQHGVGHWARRSMAGGDPTGRTAVSTQIGFIATIACVDIRADVPKIKCPTLVITTEESALASVDETRAWQQTIPDSELRVLPGNSYHVAASDAERCAQATLEFISRRN